LSPRFLSSMASHPPYDVARNAISDSPYRGGGDYAALLSAFPVLALLAMPEAAEAAVNPVASAGAYTRPLFGST
jgi:hypothetical protein